MKATTWLSGAAADTLWQFPLAVARKQVLELAEAFPLYPERRARALQPVER